MPETATSFSVAPELVAVMLPLIAPAAAPALMRARMVAWATTPKFVGVSITDE